MYRSRDPNENSLKTQVIATNKSNRVERLY